MSTQASHDKIFPPWDNDTVAALNGFQTAGRMHPFTCGGEHDGHRDLIATRDGWICPDAPACGYTQKWAHEFMTCEEWRKPFWHRQDSAHHPGDPDARDPGFCRCGLGLDAWVHTDTKRYTETPLTREVWNDLRGGPERSTDDE